MRFAERLTLAVVSNHFNMSLYTLSKRFKHYVGQGFQEYLIHRRIVETQRCLEETDLKILAVSHHAGFESLSAFNRDFRMLTGLTPSEYRRMAHAKCGKTRKHETQRTVTGRDRRPGEPDSR